MGSQPSPPTLDTNQSKALTRADYELKEEFLPRLTTASGTAGRDQISRQMEMALRGFSNPASVVYGGQISDIQKKILDLKKYPTKNAAEISKLQGQITNLQKRDPVGDLQKAFRPEFQQRDNLLKQMGAAGKTSREFNQYQRALKKGLKAQTVTAAQAKTVRGRAAGMGQVADVRAGQVGEGALGQTLMEQAMTKAASDGRLSDEASRDATQAARQGMAARGMATGSAGLAAEMLNRDRFARQRQFEDLGFAQGVQAQDLGRQFQNVGNTLAADQGNQQTQFGRQQIISGNQQQMNMANMQAGNQMNQFNAGMRQDSNMFNANARWTAGQANMGYLGQAAQNMDTERARQLGLSTDAYNFRLSTNPMLMLAGIGSPYAQQTASAVGPATSLMGGQNVTPIYSGGSPGTAGQNMMLAGTLGGGTLAAGGTIAGAAILV